VELIWQHYPDLEIRTEDGRINLYVENHQFMFGVTANQDGVDEMYTFLFGIVTGLRLAGKKIKYKAKRIVSKFDPYGEEDWEN